MELRDKYHTELAIFSIVQVENLVNAIELTLHARLARMLIRLSLISLTTS